MKELTAEIPQRQGVPYTINTANNSEQISIISTDVNVPDPSTPRLRPWVTFVHGQSRPNLSNQFLLKFFRKTE